MEKRVIRFSRALIVLMGILLLGFASAAPILNELHLNIQTTDGGGNVVTGTFNFAFNISTTSDCNSVIYSNLTSLTTDSRGIVSYYLENVALSYDNQYYLCYYRDGSLVEAAKISQTPYAYSAKTIDLSGVTVDQNLNMGLYNVTATNFFGDGSGLTNIDVGSIDLSAYYNKTFVYNTTEVDALLGSGSVNSSNYWDGLNSPADILGSSINNDLGWINFTSLSQFSNDLGVGNWTLDKPNYYTTVQTYNKTEVDNIVSIGTVNSSNYWDGLNTPGDILGSLIQNNLGWTNFTKLSEMTNDLGIGNWTLDKGSYYTSAEVDTEIGNANTSMKGYVDNIVSSGTVNSSNYWDGLDSPADILGSTINNDLSWVQLSNLVSLVGNWSQDQVNYYLISQIYNKTEVDSLITSGTSNSSNYWDGLDSPADIAGSAINDDLNWVEMSEIVAVVGNWSADEVNYYLASEVDTAIGNANTSMKNYVDAQDTYFNGTMKSYVDAAVSGGSVNSANLWDALDTPADILGSAINNDLSWINFTALSQFSNDLGIGNWTLDKPNYYLSSEVDTEIGNANTSMKSYVDSKVASDLTPYVQWTTLWSQVYNESEVDSAIGAANTSMKNYADGTFYLKSNPNAYYNVTTLPAAAAETDPMWTGNFTNGLSGNLNLNGNYLSGDGGDEGVYVEADGDVGIGNAAPTAGNKLEVTGNVNITQNITISGMTIFKDGNGDMVFRA